MAATLRIPTPLRASTSGQATVEAEGATIAAVLDDLERQHPGIKAKLVDDKGIRRFVNIFIGDEDIRFMDGINTAVGDGDDISIIPAIAGGS